MDEQFKENMNTVLSERQSSIVVYFQKENTGHFSLMEKIKSEKEAIKESLSAEAWTAVEKLLEMLRLQSYQEGKLLYTQGALDCIDLCHHVKTDYITTDYIE